MIVNTEDEKEMRVSTAIEEIPPTADPEVILRLHSVK